MWINSIKINLKNRISKWMNLYYVYCEWFNIIMPLKIKIKKNLKKKQEIELEYKDEDKSR